LAIIWQKTLKGTRYEIRKAGNTTRLYTDGVFHSQFNPNNPITRSVWDLLMLPAFFYEKDSIKRILVLGVGGGSVIQLLHKYVKPDEIVGIELNPTHTSIAKRFFGINKNIAKLHTADAISWLEKYKGQPFDMIIDDLFGEEDGEGVRPIPLNAKWLGLLNKNTTKNGLIVANTVDSKTLKESAYFTNKQTSRHFKTAYQLTTPLLENTVVAFLKKESTGKQLRKNIGQVPGLSYRSGPNKLNVRISDISLSKQ
jgi:spermidine synthase